LTADALASRGIRVNARPRVRIADATDSEVMGLFELHAIRTHHVNVLIQGTTSFVGNVLEAVGRDLEHPEFMWPDIPTNSHVGSATVLVPEVGALTARALESLADLTARSDARIQVIATSSVVLYGQVARGHFPAELYYRLNTIMLTDDVLGFTYEATLS
jgi:hypothetical protein